MNRRKNKKDYVITVSKNEVLKINCVLIDKEYYEKNIDCFSIIYRGSERWIPYNNSYCFNFTNSQYEKRKDLEAKGLVPFLVGFAGKNSEKLIFGYDIPNYVLNTEVFSHYGNKNNDYKLYIDEIKKSESRVIALQSKLEPETMFNSVYRNIIDVMSKIYYYRHYIDTDFSLEDLTFSSFQNTIRNVENYVYRSNDIKYDYQDFYQDYLNYVDKNMPVVDLIDDTENTLPKFTFEILQNDQNLQNVYNFALKYFEVVSSIQNQISVEKAKIAKYEQKIKEIKGSNFFNELCRTKEDAVNLGFVESFANDNYYLKRNLSNEDLKKLRTIPSHNQDGAYSKVIKINYNATSETGVFSRILEGYYLNRDVKTNKLNKKSYSIAKLLSGLTFGIEFETSIGRIREPDLYKYGIIPLRDGSVSGFEYTTIPYGYTNLYLKETNNQALAKDLVNMKELCAELTKRCQINAKCSMHVHIGGVRKDKLYLLAVYMLCYMIQDEMFEMFPKFKEDSPKYLGTAKNYCNKLDHLGLFENCIFDKSSVLKDNYCNNINTYFNKIFKFLSDGQEIGSKFNRKNLKHPIERKWERHGRYHWVNLVNSVFSDSRTIEFRLHTATLNFTKTLNWILICSAIVKFADTHTKEIVSGKISKISLDEVIGGYANGFRDKKETNEDGLFIHKYLNEYINSRKIYFKNKTINEDFVCESELNEDKKYSFSYLDIESLI